MSDPDDDLNLKNELIDQRKKELQEQEQEQETRIFQRYLMNAVIMAGITFLSTLKIDFPPTTDNLWAAGIAGGLALLMQLKTYYNISESAGQNNGQGIKRKKKPRLGMLIW